MITDTGKPSEMEQRDHVMDIFVVYSVEVLLLILFILRLYQNIQCL